MHLYKEHTRVLICYYIVQSSFYTVIGNFVILGIGQLKKIQDRIEWKIKSQVRNY